MIKFVPKMIEFRVQTFLQVQWLFHFRKARFNHVCASVHSQNHLSWNEVSIYYNICIESNAMLEQYEYISREIFTRCCIAALNNSKRNLNLRNFINDFWFCRKAILSMFKKATTQRHQDGVTQVTGIKIWNICRC